MKTILTIAALILSSCATPYQPYSDRGGYAEKRISDGIYIVTFTGNQYLGKEGVDNGWFRRCAELMKAEGYPYFAVSELENLVSNNVATVDTSAFAPPKTTTGTHQVQQVVPNLYRVDSTYTTTGGPPPPSKVNVAWYTAKGKIEGKREPASGLMSVKAILDKLGN